MSWLHLIRHGQAGNRAHYDALSETGEQQARLLGGHLERFAPNARVVSGALVRQQRTASIATGKEPEVDAGWSEFDLDAVYAEVAPQLAAADPEFALEYEQLQRDIQDPAHAVHRKWTAGDAKVMRGWIEGRYPVTRTETWIEFEQRVRAAGERALAMAAEAPGVVFTSATPVGITLAALFGLDPLHAMRFAGAKINSAITTVRVRPGGDLSLFTFNATPHLTDPALHTFR
jgi:broad specificity phosphatase PhoE